MSPSLHAVAGLVAGGISLLGFLPYLDAAVRGKTRPNRASWWIWSVLGALLCVSHIASGARASVWVPISLVVGPLATAIVSVRHGEGGATRFDRACFVVALLSAGVWVWTGRPLLTLVLCIGTDLAAALPTLRKCWRDPSSEDRLSWGIFLAGNAVNLLALPTLWSLEVVYPTYLFALTGLVFALLTLPRPGAARPRTKAAG